MKGLEVSKMLVKERGGQGLSWQTLPWETLSVVMAARNLSSTWKHAPHTGRGCNHGNQHNTGM